MSEQTDSPPRASAGSPRPRYPPRGSGARSFRVAVTRPRRGDGPDRLARLLSREGANPVSHPVLTLAPPGDAAPLRRAVHALVQRLARPLHVHLGERAGGGPHEWLVLTSANALPPFLSALERAGGTVQELRRGGLRVAVVGRATRTAVEAAGLPVHLVPDRFSGDDLREALIRELGPSAKEARVLLPRAPRARKALPRGLEAAGAEVEVVEAYRIVADPTEARHLARDVADRKLNVVTFTSGSAVEALAQQWPPDEGAAAWPDEVSIAAIGPVTARAVEAAGWHPGIVPAEATLEALARAVLGTEEAEGP